ncbi:hypothetical protein C5B42_05260 [Candidatus Cerribacteria bacterium 'Amazon FNV 2010 28 9']|uniref:DNA 3'-5' helicase n=1 Tax=Candidatus Cerribacteria bacterium 'Amazon FNV 2010 28 9' TaxID=2081795 RepID=A0A317JNL8_9BACT|nr:MAG: hypothetical protein C5B42_05260 [Candidatus Cerribacteria bacterium 'Amazon FNV 2010 28 9']
MSTAFQEAYSHLNPEQKLAVDTIDGPVMVIAGPGTGKTQILTVRIANILQKTDINPRNILALTFTESTATTMRNRLLSIIGEAAYYVRISTFHAFCASIIQDNPEEFPLPHESSPLTELERFEIISQIIRDNELEVLKPINDPMYYAKSVVSSISQLKREGVSIERYQQLVDDEGVWLESQKEELKRTEFRKRERTYFKHKDMVVLYEQYQSMLHGMSRYDFDDMIALTDQVLSTNEELLQEYQERFQYILVDEYQDTNGAQNHVVNLLAQFWGEEANIFVVGDSNQSIYRFQGASAENVLSFVDAYPRANIITLTQNYRSTQPILDAACSLITHNRQEATMLANPVNLHSQVSDGTNPQVVHLPTAQLETIYIADRIQELINAGTNPNQIALIYRNNADSSSISDVLARWNIPFCIEGGVNILHTPIITQLFTLLHVLNGMRQHREDIDLFTLLNYEWVHADSLTVLQYAREASKRGVSLFETITERQASSVKRKRKSLQPEQHSLFEHQETEILNATLTPHQEHIHSFINKLIDLIHKERQLTFVHWFELLLQESGFLSYVLNRSTAHEDLSRLNTLFNEIKKMCDSDHTCSLERFMEIIATMNDHGLAIAEENQHIESGVQLTTAHRSKGQEWDYVFIMTAIDGKWGNNGNKQQIPVPEGIIVKSKRSDAETKSLEDERRLFYVALTRARTQVTITIPDTVISGNRTKETVPSLFVSELDAHITSSIPPEYNGAQQQEALTRLLTAAPHKEMKEEEKEWLTNLLENFKLSATALNTYIDCHYKFKLNHLLKVPRARDERLSLGTAVHKALELFFKEIQKTGGEGRVPPVEFLTAAFETALKKEIITTEGFTRRLAQGRRILTMYYEAYKDEFHTPLFCERTFGYGMSTTQFGGIPLNGKVDRIDWLDKEKNTVKITDYKTGRARSLNDIEGKTSTSTGSYKRQLVFYKLLTQLDRSFTPNAEMFEFDFVEPDKQTGKHKRVSVAVTNEEVQELKELIKHVYQDIRSLKFERTTDTRICHTCEFARHCWPEGIPAAIAAEISNSK